MTFNLTAKALGRTIWWTQTCYGCGHGGVQGSHEVPRASAVIRVDTNSAGHPIWEKVEFITYDGDRIDEKRVTAISLKSMYE